MAKKKLSELTVVDVIGAALEQISTEEGYTNQYYFSRTNTRGSLSKPGPTVGATCAIGSVEQSLWRLTGKIVTDERMRISASYPENRDYGLLSHPRSIASKLYLESMVILNKIALRTRAARDFARDGCPIEQLTCLADHKTVVRAFRRALTEAEKQVEAPAL